MSSEVGVEMCPPGWSLTALTGYVTHKSGDSKIIKGKQSSAPASGLVQGYSASGPDVWVEEAKYHGPGIVVSAVGARCGKTFLADGQWTAIANTHAIIPKHGLDPKFFWYVTNREEWWVKSGTAQPFVKVKDTLERPFAMPPFEEQREIVRILEEQFSRLDAAAASIAAVRRKADQFRRSLLNFAFDEGPSSRSKGGSGVEGVGSWSTESLRQIASGGLFVDGDWVESKDQDPNGQIRLTQLADVGVGVFKDKSDRWLRRDQAAKLGVTFLEENDLLIARMPDPLGRCCAVPKLPSDAVTVVDVAILRIARTDIDSRFVMWALNSPKMRAAMTKVASGTTRLRISRKNLESIEIPIPVLEEQMKVVEALEDQFSRLEKSLASVDEIERRISALRRSLLHAAFTGELTKIWREKNNG